MSTLPSFEAFKRGLAAMHEPHPGITITLPIPAACLNPNRAEHWRTKGKARAQQRADAFAWSTSKFPGAGPKWERARVMLRWFAKDSHRIPDIDNAIASIKGALDGMTDAGVMLNDRGIEGIDVWRVVDKAKPRVEITVTPVNQEASR